MSNGKTSVHRSWTANDEPRVGKWLPVSLLTCLLLAGLGIFAYSVWWRSAPRTFATVVAITEYDEQLLPQPAYAEWDVQGTVGAFPSHGLNPWEVAGLRLPKSKNELDQVLQSLDRNLQQQGMTNRDTVLVYLRGHALVLDGQAYLLTGDFERSDVFQTEDDSEDDSAQKKMSRKISLTEILSHLQRIQARNVVLLADICDLPTVPKLGVVANHVPELIERAAADLGKDRPVWVITAATSLQPGHVSYLKERTLLQSACEYACDSKRAEKGEGFLSLARFYEAILRYSHQVTGGDQTPLLFRCGAQGRVLDSGNNRALWNAAREVRIARAIERVEEDADEAQEEDEVAGRVPADDPRPVGRFVARMQSDANAGEEQVDESDAESKAASADEVETSPWLRYWQLHDRLRRRENNPAGWAPVDFAAEHWRDSELDAARLERLHRPYRRQPGASPVLRQMEQRVEELERLQRLMLRGEVEASDSSRLVAAWNRFQDELKPEKGKLPWSRPDWLPDAQQQRWLPIREGYRLYLDAMGQLSGWLDEVLHEDVGRRGELLQRLEGLVDALARLDAVLPDEDEAVLDHPLDASSVRALRNALAGLNQYLERRVQEEWTELQNSKSALASPLTWSDERRLQQLLLNTNLSFEDRKRLVTAYDNLTTADLDEPDTENNPLDNDLELKLLLEGTSMTGPLTGLAKWCSVVQRALRMASPQSVNGNAGESAEQLNAWGKQVLTEFQSESAKTNARLRWKQTCLNDLDLFPRNEGYNSGLIATVSLDGRLHVQVPSEIFLASSTSTPSLLDCRVKRFNGAPVGRCYLKWDWVDVSGFRGNRRDLLRVFLRQELAPGVAHAVEIPLPGGVGALSRQDLLALRLETQVDQDQMRGGAVLQIAIADDEAGLSEASAARRVRVFLPNPDRVELHARCLNPGAEQDEILRREELPFGTVLKRMAVPAIGGQATSSYEFYLSNRSDQDKTVTARLYPVQGTRSLGNGRPDQATANLTRRELARLKPNFESEPIRLSKNEARSDGRLPSNAQPIVWKPVDASKPSAPIGEFGLLCVIREVEVVENQVLDKVGAEPFLQWIECVPENPVQGLVDIIPEETRGQFVFQVEVPESHWTRWGLEELQIDLMMTDLRGNEVEFSGRRTAILKPEPGRASTDSLRLKPNQPSNEPLVAHLTIGDYPRAIAFSSWLRGTRDETRSASQAFVWFDLNQAECRDAEGKLVATQPREDEVVVPAYVNVDDMSLGTEVALSTVSGPLRIDFPKNGLPGKATVKLGSFAQDYEVDRQFLPNLEIVDGNLAFHSSVQDLQYHVDAAAYGFNGRETFEATVGDREDSITRSGAFLFDRRPPPRGAVSIEPSVVYADDEALVVSIDVTDDDSAIDRVFFAIDQDGIRARQFNAKDPLHKEAQNFNNLWSRSWPTAELAELGLGRYRVVCRTIDQAGNVQDAHLPGNFELKAGKRPVEAPPPKKKVVPAKKPPRQPVEHTVVVEILVNGKTPDYPKNTSVSGVPGATEANNSGTWTFTKVPNGTYEVTGTYTDPFGVEYEGKGRLNVPATTRVRINTQRKK